MQIHLSDALSRADQTKMYTIPLSMEQITYYGEKYPVVEKEPVELSIYHKGEKKLLITVTVMMKAKIPCDRCLTDVIVPLEFTSEVEVDMNLTEEERIANLEEAAFIEGYTLDVDKLVEGELFVHMPMKVLCSVNCKGLKGKGGTAPKPGTCDCEEAGLDPRMAVIRDIFQKANQEGNKEV